MAGARLGSGIACSHSVRNTPVKDFVISVNNIALYVSLGWIWLVALITLFNVGFLQGLGVFDGVSLVWCIVSGFWFVQSATYEVRR